MKILIKQMNYKINYTILSKYDEKIYITIEDTWNASYAMKNLILTLKICYLHEIISMEVVITSLRIIKISFA